MRLVIVLILILFLGALLTQSYFIFKERSVLQAQLLDLNNQLGSLKSENTHLKSEIDYLSHPENLEKELKARFNERKPDEKMIIIVP